MKNTYFYSTFLIKKSLKQNKKIEPEIFKILENQFLIHNLINTECKNDYEKYIDILGKYFKLIK